MTLLAGLALAQRIEAAEAANGIECARAQAGMGAAVEQVAGGWALFVGVNSMLTHAVGLGMSGPVTAAEVDRVETFFRGRNAPVQIDLCPLAHPTLIEILGHRGYRISEFNNVLVRPLAGEAPLEPDGRIRAAGPGENRLWARTIAAGFFEREQLSEEEIEVGETLFRAAGTHCFLGWTAAGCPAAGAAMAIRDGVATFFADSTVTGFRGAGLHSALIRTRLNEAVRAECAFATASTLPGSTSQRNYERLGFRVVYTRVALSDLPR